MFSFWMYVAMYVFFTFKGVQKMLKPLVFTDNAGRLIYIFVRFI